jgi:hypothetical protein
MREMMIKQGEQENEGWMADLIGFISVAGFASVCILILMGGVIVDSMKDVGLILLGQLSMRIP